MNTETTTPVAILRPDFGSDTRAGRPAFDDGVGARIVRDAARLRRASLRGAHALENR